MKRCYLGGVCPLGCLDSGEPYGNQHYYTGEAKYYIKVGTRFLTRHIWEGGEATEEGRQAKNRPGLRMQSNGCPGLFQAEHHKFTSSRCQARNLNVGLMKNNREWGDLRGRWQTPKGLDRSVYPPTLYHPLCNFNTGSSLIWQLLFAFFFFKDFVTFSCVCVK